MADQPLKKDDRLEQTRLLLAEAPKLRAGKTLITAAETALNWWNRALYTYAAAAEDPSVRLGPYGFGLRPEASTWKSLERHWGTDEAKQYRLHNLHSGEAVGRAMYTAWTMGNNLYKHPVETASVIALDDGFRKFGFKSPTALERIRQVYESDRASEFVRKNGELVVDLPVSLAWDLANPLNLAVSGAYASRHVRYAQGVLENAPRRMSQTALRDWVIGHFEGAPWTKHFGEAVADRLALKDTAGAAQLLAAAGFHKPSVLSEISPKWLRKAGRGWSSAEETLIANNAERLAETDRLFKRKAAESEVFAKAMDSLSPTETVQFAYAVNNADSVRDLQRLIQEGRAPVSRNVVAAFEEYQHSMAKDYVRRATAWDERALSRADRIEQIDELLKNKDTVVEVQAKLAHERKQLLADAPPFLDNYFVNLSREPGEAVRNPDKLRPFARMYMNPKGTVDPAEYAKWVDSQTPDQLKERAKKLVDGVLARDPSEAKELAIKRHITDIGAEISRVEASVPTFFGGQRNKDRVLGGLRAMKQQAVEAASAPKESGALDGLLKTYDTLHLSWKQSVLFGPAYTLQNAVDNSIKNVTEIGVRAFVPPNLHAVDGSDLVPHFFRDGDALKKEGVEMVRKNVGVLDLPGIRQAKEATFDRLNNSVEKFTRVNLGAHVYHDRAQELMRLQPDLPKSEVHKLALAQARSVVDRVQFYQEPSSRAMQWIDRVVPFARFNLDTLAFTADLSVRHPIVPAAYLRVQDQLRQASVAGDGRLRVPGTDVYVDPLSYLAQKKIVAGIERAPDYEPGDTAVDTAVNVGRHMAALAGNQIRVTPYTNLVEDLMNGKMANAVSDTGDRTSQRAARESLFRLRQAFPFVLVDRPLAAATGMHLDQFAASKGVVVGKVATSDFEQWERTNKNLQLEAAAQRGERITPEEAVQRVYSQERARSIGFLFGLDLTHDPDGAAEKLRRLRRAYHDLSGEDARSAMFYGLRSAIEDKPLMQGWGTKPDRVPEQSEAHDFIRRFNDAKTDEEKLDILRGADKKERGWLMLNGVWDWAEKAGESVASAVREELRLGLGTGEAQAAGLPPGAVQPPKEVGVPVQAPEAGLNPSFSSFDAKYADAMLIKPGPWQGAKRPVGLELLKDTGEMTLDGRVDWSRIPKTADRDMYLSSLEVSSQANTAFRMLRADFMTAQTEGELKALRTKIYDVNPGGEARSFNSSWFFEPDESGRPRLYDTMRNVSTRGPVDAQSGQMRTIYGGESDSFAQMQRWVLDGTVPQRIQINEEKRKKQLEVDLHPWIERMSDSAKFGTPQPAPLFDEIRRAERAGVAPKGFFEAVRSSSVPDRYDRLANYALARKTDRMEAFHNYIYSSEDQHGNRYVSPAAVDMALLYDGQAELVLLAQDDKKLARMLQERGYSTDPLDAQRLALRELAAETGMRPWTTADVKASGGLVDGSFLPVDTYSPFDATPARGGEPVLPGSAAEARQIERVQPPISVPVGSARPGALNLPVFPRMTRFDPGAMLPRRSFRSSNEYLEAVVDDTRRVNSFYQQTENVMLASRAGVDVGEVTRLRAGGMGLDQIAAKYDVSPIDPLPRQGLWSTAAHHVATVQPMMLASSAYSVLQLSNRLGLVGNDEMRVLGRGMTQASLQNAGTEAFTAMFNAGAWVMGGESVSARWAKMPADQQQAWATAGKVGALLSLSSGFLAAEGEREAAIATGALGGALQGAQLGSAFGGIGIAVGAIAGGALGGFLGSSEDDRQRYDDMRALQRQELQQRIQFGAERQTEFRVDVDLRRGEASRRALNTAGQPGTQTPRVSPAGQRLREYMRRPTFGQQQGLAREVERNVAPLLRPRY